MGNVPIVRMDPQQAERINIIIARLLDEVLKDFLWRCRIQLVNTEQSAVQFVPACAGVNLTCWLKVPRYRAAYNCISRPTLKFGRGALI